MTKLDIQTEAIRAALLECGFREDAYGHFIKLSTSYMIRVKMQSVSVRLELKEARPNAEWRKIDGAYMKDVVILPEGVKIGRKVVKRAGA